MGCMAINTGRPDLMTTVIPAFVGGVHHVTIVTRRGIIAEIRCEISGKHPDSQDGNQANQTYDDGNFQLTLSQIILIYYTSGVEWFSIIGYLYPI